MSAKKRALRNSPETHVEPQPPSRPRRVRTIVIYGSLALVAFGLAYAMTTIGDGPPTPPPGMVWIPPGQFTMGTSGEQAQRNEQPAHAVRISGFFMDETEVTNASFRAFVDATGYVTVAEKKPDWDEMKKTLLPGTPKPDEALLVPGALAFVPPNSAVPLDNVGGWWRWTVGACWKSPEGPGSNLDGRDDHPVVQLAWEDAVAYATWAGKRLPTEAEWEYAARGGLAGKRFCWGDEAPTDTEGRKANIWQGDFPHRNAKADGYDRTAPVKSYAPNGFGLYDMAGNVWEWCGDWYRADAYAGRANVQLDPTGPTTFWDPSEPLVPKRVTRGGSFLCHVTYCESYRPAARRGTAVDTGMSHLGFRCVKDAKPKPARSGS